MRRLFVTASYLLALGGFNSGCGAAPVVCVGTGVSDPTAAVSIDLADLTNPEASAVLHVGDKLYIGSNGCDDYGLPSSNSIGPFLVEESRHQQNGTGGAGNHSLDVIYRAAKPGRIIVSIKCRGESCPGSQIRITVTVVDLARSPAVSAQQTPSEPSVRLARLSRPSFN